MTKQENNQLQKLTEVVNEHNAILKNGIRDKLNTTVKEVKEISDTVIELTTIVKTQVAKDAAYAGSKTRDKILFILAIALVGLALQYAPEGLATVFEAIKTITNIGG